MTNLTSWGLYPNIDANVSMPISKSGIENVIVSSNSVTIRGNGRSYGDSALGDRVLCSLGRDNLIELDRKKQTVRVNSGITMDRLLEFLIPRGYFPPVVPGTKYVTIGGAVASDIHGKNHHKEGTFSQHVQSLTLMTSTGELIECSPNQNSDLFQATCGGMGLTGFIQDVEFSLKSIQSDRIDQTTHKARNLDELLELFDLYQGQDYSVAWIDCLSKGTSLGRGIMFVGSHAKESKPIHFQNRQFPLPVPALKRGVLNSKISRLFNFAYFNRHLKKVSRQHVGIDSFFFPLDKIQSWNHLYGKNGFTQYQFVIPKSSGPIGLTRILEKISHQKNISFLSVLKLFGPQNQNYMSFPIEGYTLSLDFQITPELFPFLDELNQIVIEHGGRVYLTKDVCLSKNDFEKMYGKNIEEFQNVREKFNVMKFNSLQSRRLGL